MAEHDALDKIKEMLDAAITDMKQCYGEHCKVMEEKIADFGERYDPKLIEEQIRTCVGKECEVLHGELEKLVPKPDEPDELPPDGGDWSRCGGCGNEFTGKPRHCPGCGKRLDW